MDANQQLDKDLLEARKACERLRIANKAALNETPGTNIPALKCEAKTALQNALATIESQCEKCEEEKPTKKKTTTGTVKQNGN
jgi:hypothetical protein